MLKNIASSTPLLEKLIDFNRSLFTGQLLIKGQDKFWTFHFSLGWIFYASVGSIQKLHRKLLLLCPALKSEELSLEEYQLIVALFSAGKINSEQIKKLVFWTAAEALCEVFFAQAPITYDNKQELTSTPIAQIDPEELAANILEADRRWHSARISGNFLDWAPALKQAELALGEHSSYPYGLINGQSTLLDIAALQAWNIVEFIALTLEEVRRGTIDLVKINGNASTSKCEAIRSDNKSCMFTTTIEHKSEKRKRKQSLTSPTMNPPKTRCGFEATQFCLLTQQLCIKPHLVLVRYFPRLSIFPIFLTVGYLRVKKSYLFYLLIFLSSLLLCASIHLVSSWNWRNVSQSSPTAGPDIKIYKSISSIPRVPDGLFNYGGEQILSESLQSVINQSLPGFQLRFVEPIDGMPGSTKGVIMLQNQELAFSQNFGALTEQERTQAASLSIKLQEIPVALDAIVFFVHPDVKLSGLSVDQLQAIYTGKVSNCQQIGGPDMPIHPIGDDPTDSATLNLLLADVGGAKARESIIDIRRDYNSAESIVANSPGSIGFAVASSFRPNPDVRWVPIASQNSHVYVPPYSQNGQINLAAIKDGSYPLVHRVFIDFRRDGTPDEQAAVAYANILLSNAGQRLVQAAGFIPIR